MSFIPFLRVLFPSFISFPITLLIYFFLCCLLYSFSVLFLIHQRNKIPANLPQTNPRKGIGQSEWTSVHNLLAPPRGDKLSASIFAWPGWGAVFVFKPDGNQIIYYVGKIFWNLINEIKLIWNNLEDNLLKSEAQKQILNKNRTRYPSQLWFSVKAGFTLRTLAAVSRFFEGSPWSEFIAHDVAIYQ